MATENMEKIARKRHVKRLKDANAPKAPLTPYLKFGIQQRKQNPSISSLPVGEQGKMLSEMWKNISEEEKDKMKAEYAEEKEKYNQEMEEYKKTDAYEDWAKESKKLKETVGGKKKRRVSQSAYIVYVKEQYPIVAGQNQGMAMKDVTSEVAKQWKALSEADRQKYKDTAAEFNKMSKEKENTEEELISEEISEEE